jgi:hypothetical protein
VVKNIRWRPGPLEVLSTCRVAVGLQRSRNRVLGGCRSTRLPNRSYWSRRGGRRSLWACRWTGRCYGSKSCAITRGRAIFDELGGRTSKTIPSPTPPADIGHVPKSTSFPSSGAARVHHTHPPSQIKPLFSPSALTLPTNSSQKHDSTHHASSHNSIRTAPAGGAAAAAPERDALTGPSAPTSTSTRWAPVTM